MIDSADKGTSSRTIPMNKLNNTISNQFFIFTISLIIFIIAAAFGWEKLHYGFNFIDEGFDMTEAWRLTVGDHLFQYKLRGAIDLSPFINSFFFRIRPDITLLGFRELQYIFTICVLMLFSISLYRLNGHYWYLPLSFSIFAFTGLEPIGIVHNLSYQSYPNLFVTLYVSLLLFGFNQTSVILRRALFIAAGLFLWLISFSLLHLSFVLCSPIILLYFLRKWKVDGISFDFGDLCFVLAPSIICWAAFIAVFNVSYIQNVIYNVQSLTATKLYRPESLFSMNWSALERVGIVTIYLVTSLYFLSRVRIVYFLMIFTVLSTIVFFIIDTSFFGLISYPYDYIFVSRPMWFSSLIISFFILISCFAIYSLKTHRQLQKTDVLAIALVTPCIILAASSSIFSSIGLLTILDSSIPVIAAMSILVLSHKKINAKHYLVKLLILLMLLAPFYYSTAWSNWRFTFFDVVPELANAEIDKGFGKGIRTNPMYKKLYDWIDTNAEDYTRKGDFIISYCTSPMVHMIAKCRPALDMDYIDFAFPFSYYETAIIRMKKSGREPNMAFIFEREPKLVARSMDRNADYEIPPKVFSFPSGAEDPISQYIIQNMSFLNEFKYKSFIVKCYIRRQ